MGLYKLWYYNIVLYMLWFCNMGLYRCVTASLCFVS